MPHTKLPARIRARLRRDIEARGDRQVSTETKLARVALLHGLAGLPVTVGTRIVIERHYAR